ncbi:MAG: glycosyltransferase family 4 protein [Desulfatibacillaceae bacterium]
MRVGVDAVFLVPGQGGGIERWFRETLCSMDGRGIVVFANRDVLPTLELPEGAEVVMCPVGALPRWRRVAWHRFLLPGLVERARLDVLLCPGNFAPTTRATPVVPVVHDLVFRDRPRDFGVAERLGMKSAMARTIAGARHVIAVSRFTADRLLEIHGVRESRVTVIRGAPAAVFTPRGPRVEREGGYVLCPVSRKAHKNTWGALAAWARVLESNAPCARLVVFGDLSGWEGAFGELLRRPGVAGSVEARGRVDDAELAALYRGAAAFFNPSMYEGFGLPVLEAMACGAPVVAARGTGMEEAAAGCGLLVDPRDPADMARGLCRVLADQVFSRDLAARGLAHARKRSFADTAREVRAVLAGEAAREPWN